MTLCNPFDCRCKTVCTKCGGCREIDHIKEVCIFDDGFNPTYLKKSRDQKMMNEKKCITCEKLADICLDCVAAGNESLKRYAKELSDRISVTLGLLEQCRFDDGFDPTYLVDKVDEIYDTLRGKDES